MNNNVMIFGMIGFVIVCLVGWVMNIIALVGAINDPLTGMILLRGIGIIVAPLGSVLGFFF